MTKTILLIHQKNIYIFLYTKIIFYYKNINIFYKIMHIISLGVTCPKERFTVNISTLFELTSLRKTLH